MKKACVLAAVFLVVFMSTMSMAADSTVQVYGQDSKGIPRPIGATAGVSGLYSLQISTVSSGTVDSYSKGTTEVNNQISVGSTVTVLLASSTTRRAVTFVNHSTTVAVYVGDVAVTTSTGILLNPGQAVTFSASAGAAWSAITSSSTATVGYVAENN